MRKPAIIEVSEAYAWKASIGESIRELYPGGIPNVVVNALFLYNAGFQAGQEASRKHARDKAKWEAAIKNSTAGNR